MTDVRSELVDVLVVRLDAGLPLPEYAHPGDAGVDLVSTIDVEVAPGSGYWCPRGIAIALPDGYRRVRPPSQWAGDPRRADGRECARHGGRGVPWRDQGGAGQPGPREVSRGRSGETGSLNLSCSASRRSRSTK